MEDNDIQTFSTTHPDLPPAAPQPAATDDAPLAPEAASAAEPTSGDQKAPSIPEDDDAPKPGETPQQTAARTRSRLQKRINELTAARYTEKGRAERLEQELTELRKRTDPAPNRSSDTPSPDGDQSGVPAAPQGDDFERTNPKPKQENFDTYDEFNEALLDWKVDQREHRRETANAAEAARQAAAERVVQVQQRIDTFKQQHPDFHEVLNAADFEVPKRVLREMEESPVGPQIAYHLAKNPAEAAAICKLHPVDQIKAVGKLEARFEREAGAPTPTPRKPVSRAPQPLAPEGGGSAATNKALDQMTTDERLDHWDREEQASRTRR
jgi:O6-methylguanine-DNA--protein-cysteine methyltransferase